MMEDVSTTQNHTVQLGPPSGGISINSKQSQDDHNQRPHYSIPGILHYIQHEWARFEMERAQWEVERAELQVSLFKRELRFMIYGYRKTMCQACLKHVYNGYNMHFVASLL